MDRHIELLLMKYDCVILPGFGGFVKHHVSARMDKNTGIMLPPMETVGFNPQLTLNDSLLVQSYVEAYDYSFPEALSIVETEINELRNVLHFDGRYEIRSVGVLEATNHGTLVFEPARSGIINPQLYGLPGIETTRADCFICRANMTEPDSTDNLSDGEKEAHTGGKESNDAAEERNDDIVIRIPRRVFRRAVAACIVLLVIAAIPFVGSKVNTKGLISGINLDFICNLIPKADTTRNAETYVIHDTTAVPEPKDSLACAPLTEEIKADSAVSPAADTLYTLVLASRISETNARRYVEKLGKENNITARVAGKNKEIKVVYGGFATREEAQQARRELASNPEFADVWITETAGL